MFENYEATKEDLSAVDAAISYVWRPELNFVFKDVGKVKDTLVVSYDSEHLLLWRKKPIDGLERAEKSPKSRYFYYQIPHHIKINDREQRGWRASLKIKEFEKILPEVLKGKTRFELPIICGPLLGPFVKTHQKLKKSGKRPFDPYDTYESYLATIAHEFAHIYYNQHKLWWFSDKNSNLELLKTAKDLYEGEKRIPAARAITQPVYMGEVFAFCAEYTASSIFWPKHRENIDKEAIHMIKKFFKGERGKNLDREDSALEDPHNIALVLGKILIETYPDTWVKKILVKNKM